MLNNFSLKIFSSDDSLNQSNNAITAANNGETTLATKAKDDII
jgi:20S proteasome alpha/beta subunit